MLVRRFWPVWDGRKRERKREGVGESGGEEQRVWVLEVEEVERSGGVERADDAFSVPIIGFVLLSFALCALTDRLFDAARHDGETQRQKE